MIVELFGPARVLAGAAELDVPIGGSVDLPGFAAALAAACPALVGDVVRTDRRGFVEPNYVLLDGRRAVAADARFGPADRPCVLFLASGG